MCRAHLVKVQSRRERIEDAGATVLFVAFDDVELLRGSLLHGIEPSFPVLVDRERHTYRGWGLRRSSAAGVWLDPRVWWRYAMLAGRGERLRLLGSDTLQLGGDFVVDRDGRIAWARPQRRDDRPPVAELVAAIEAAAV
ncbi:MAG: redoxin domain-containing protein [Thermoleophilia bacterium]|nr:redoxin domain-containing protein [Thermoleophilia bacterium]MDH4346864.1 redoxin domain-containing protein [Thermoleophilia bacterium]